MEDTPAAPNTVDPTEGKDPAGSEPVAPDPEGKQVRPLPQRYSIRDQEKRRVLVCVEAPTLSIVVDRGLSINGGAARKYPAGTIFLDGVAQGEPFIDSEREVFNLDHHEGCVRAFTLATCEQAMVMVRMGLDLRKRDWTIYAAEPDLDTVLAIWILLNHIRLGDANPAVRTAVMPLVRLQGTIDTHGLEMQDLVGFPPDLARDTMARLESLRARELELKRLGLWNETDLLRYTIEVLRDLDHLVYSSLDFEETLEVEELAQARISGQWLVIACRSETGIYEVERHLRRLHGDRLGIIVLQKDDSTYTLRRVNHFLPVSLGAIYRRLNALDPAAGGARSGNRWGGSEEIGGSPRAKGTKLTAAQIVEACSTAYRRPDRLQALTTLILASAASLTVMLAAVSVIAIHGFLRQPFPSLGEVFHGRTQNFAAVLGGLSLLTLILTSRKPGRNGLCIPAGWDWLIPVPAAMIASLVGGAWFPAAFVPGEGLLSPMSETAPVTLLLFAIAAELLFRGSVHGLATRTFSIQKTGGRWFLSWPAMISSALYAAWALFPYQASSLLHGLQAGCAVFVFALTCAMARERSGSILPPVFIHCFCLLLPVVY